MWRQQLSAVRCQRLALQGFDDLDAGTLSDLAPWLRFTPALCGVGWPPVAEVFATLIAHKVPVYV
jgi:hypothetical protein